MSLLQNVGSALFGDSTSLSSLGKLVDFDKIANHPLGQVANQMLEKYAAKSKGNSETVSDYGLTTRRMDALAPQKRKSEGGFWSGVKRFASGGLGAVGSGLSNFGTIGAAALGMPELSPVVGLAGGLFSSLSKLLS